jgi:hypothetical protein
LPRFVRIAANPPKAETMTLGVWTIQPIVALIAGILILLAPRLLNYIVAIYLIIFGVLGLWPGLLNGGTPV